MSAREVIFLGTASQVPTRARNHNALFVRWDDLGVLVDPGEGTQRQMVHAGLAATQITHILITHFHGDHCLGLAALVQRISLDQVPHPIEVIYPRSGQIYFERLRHASIFHDVAKIVPRPIDISAGTDEITVAQRGDVRITARALDHRVETYGYRLQEAAGRRLLPERLKARGLQGAAIGKLVRDGSLQVGAEQVTLAEVSEVRPGQALAVIMDTRPCPGAHLLAAGVDLLVCESTYLSSESVEAHDHYHMTAAQAATLGREAGARRLALTHFSQRYVTLDGFRSEAGSVHDDVFVAEDLCVVAVPKRQIASPPMSTP